MDFYQSMTTKQVRDPTLIHFTIDALDSEERSSFRGPVQDFRGIFFGPHHLIMAALLYFEEKLMCQILEYLSYPSNPQLERKRICREVFTLDKWTNMTAYRAEQPELPQPTEIPAARRASPDHIPEGIPIASPTISRAPQLLQPHQSPLLQLNQGWPFPFQSIEIYATYCRPLPRLRLQHHLGLPSVAEHLTPTTAVPHSQAIEPQAPPKSATEEAEPSA
ncbi:hypothetical protein CK203_038690 [Vitis vinifera]|uniref:Uncharacterized protein n=1 Tax=Vitis vinifera TaxID=29760 RepID=A0A438HUT2_VITVI|nr:hypothetical protein CK203_038690 [Vitis vinifera]